MHEALCVDDLWVKGYHGNQVRGDVASIFHEQKGRAKCPSVIQTIHTFTLLLSLSHTHTQNC